MKDSSLKTRYLLLLDHPFSLEIPYTDRQRVLIVADDQVQAERQARARIEAAASSEPIQVSGDETDSADASYGAVVSRRFQRGLHGLHDAGATMKRSLDDRTARWALRRQLGALMIGQTESALLRFDRGHPLKNVLYVGHPAKPDLYFPAAEFHRRVFEHKFVEAVNLLRSLGACRIVVQQEQGQVREKERVSFAMGSGFTRTRSEQTRSGALFEAEFPGSQEPSVPEGLCWYPDEPTWQMIGDARIASGAQKTSLLVTYTTDYGIDTRVIRAAGACGLNIGGRFEEQRDLIWRLDAEFPSLSD